MMFNSDSGLLRFCSKLALRFATRHTRTENWLIATRAKVLLRRQRRDVGTALLQPCRKSGVRSLSNRFLIDCTSRLDCSTRCRNSSERQAEKKKGKLDRWTCPSPIASTNTQSLRETLQICVAELRPQEVRPKRKQTSCAHRRSLVIAHIILNIRVSGGLRSQSALMMQTATSKRVVQRIARSVSSLGHVASFDHNQLIKRRQKHYNGPATGQRKTGQHQKDTDAILLVCQTREQFALVPND